MFSRRSHRRQNKKSGKQGQMQVKMKPGTSIRVPGQRALWTIPRRFVMLDETRRAFRSDPLVDVVAKFEFNIRENPFLDSMSGLFDEFKLVRIHLVYKPLIDEVQTPHSSTIGSAFTVPEVVFSFWPYSTTPSTFAEIAQRGDSIVTSSVEQWQSTFKPIPLVRGYDNLTSDAFLNTGPKWITTDRNETPHYGFVIGMRPTNSISLDGPQFGGIIEIYYTVDFRYPRRRGVSQQEKKLEAPTDWGAPHPEAGCDVAAKFVVAGEVHHPPISSVTQKVVFGVKQDPPPVRKSGLEEV